MKKIKISLFAFLTALILVVNVFSGTYAFADEVNISNEMNLTLNYIKSNNHDEWSALTLSKFGIAGNKEFFNTYVAKFSEGVSAKGLSGYFKNDTDLEKAIIYITSQGYSPYNFLGNNLVSELFNRDINEFGSEYNIYANIYGLITYDYANINESSYKIKRQDLINNILSKEVTDNDSKLTGWGFGSIDIDTTAIVINAISGYSGKINGVKKAIDDGVLALSSLQGNNGRYMSWGNETSESISVTILGLISAGVNPNGDQFTKTGNNLVTALLSFKGDNGQYNHDDSTSGKNNYVSTEEALRTLYALNEFNKNGNKAFNYYASSIDAKNLPIYVKQDDNKKNEANETNKTNGTKETNVTNEANEAKNDTAVLPQTGGVIDTSLLIIIGVVFVSTGLIIKKKHVKGDE